LYFVIVGFSRVDDAIVVEDAGTVGRAGRGGSAGAAAGFVVCVIVEAAGAVDVGVAGAARSSTGLRPHLNSLII
jgi:hypothetical protein